MARATLVAVEYASEPDAELALGIVRDLDDEDALASTMRRSSSARADGRVELRQSREFRRARPRLEAAQSGPCSALRWIPVPAARLCRGGDGFSALDKGSRTRRCDKSAASLRPARRSSSRSSAMSTGSCSRRASNRWRELVAAEVSARCSTGSACALVRLVRGGSSPSWLRRRRWRPTAARSWRRPRRRVASRRSARSRPTCRAPCRGSSPPVPAAPRCRSHRPPIRPPRRAPRSEQGVGLLVEARRLGHAGVHVGQDPEPRQVASCHRPKTFRGLRLAVMDVPFPQQFESVSKD